MNVEEWVEGPVSWSELDRQCLKQEERRRKTKYRITVVAHDQTFPETPSLLSVISITTAIFVEIDVSL